MQKTKQSDPQEQSSQVGFDQLGLSPTSLEAIANAGYTEPTPVQAGLIPRALAGKDVVGQARTGTGKTAAFVLPVLEQLEKRGKNAAPQALILTPTRELAVQVREEVIKLSHGRKVRSVAVYGGKPIRDQIEKLRRGAEIIVGTPGRVLDHIGRNTVRLDELRLVILDEADRMLDIGFRPDIEKILRSCPKQRQTLLLSATVPPPVQRLSTRYMIEPEMLNFSQEDVAGETIEQYYFTVEETRKFELLVRLLEREQPQQAIVFCRTKRGTQKIHDRLSKRHQGVDCIHGDMNQSARDRAMKKFRSGDVRILVATDVVGRGIDVTGISHIINYDTPQFSDDYVHRVGRTGRMGREGVAYTFVTPEQGNELTRIEMRINKLLKRDEVEGVQTITPTVPPSEEAQAAAGPAQRDPAEGDRAAEQPEQPQKKESDKPKLPGRRRGKRHRRAL